MSKIAAICTISLSELQYVFPEQYRYFPEKYMLMHVEALTQALFMLGMDVTDFVEEQDSIEHRNKLGVVVNCKRWVGTERGDKKWLDSGCASVAALDRAKDNKLLNDMYSLRGLSE
jgi:hypothetical protein